VIFPWEVSFLGDMEQDDDLRGGKASQKTLRGDESRGRVRKGQELEKRVF